jgi:hypothetical protein
MLGVVTTPNTTHMYVLLNPTYVELHYCIIIIMYLRMNTHKHTAATPTIACDTFIVACV